MFLRHRLQQSLLQSQCRQSCARLFSIARPQPSTKITKNLLSNKGPITWKTVVATLIVAAGGIWYLNKEKATVMEKRKQKEAEMSNAAVGKPKIGGPFTLTDCDTGKEVTEKSFLGKYMLIYFGFTHCPDICPDELEKMSKAITKLDLMGEGIGEMLVPVFISVDPGRDSPAVVKQYIKEFHPRFIGLTGTEEQVQQAAKAYRIYISKNNTGGDDYLVDHSIFFFLMDPNGQLSDYYGRNSTSDEVVQSIATQIRKWKQDTKAGRI